MSEQPPYRSYAAIVATFAGGLAAAGLRADPRARRGTSFVREPFVEGHAHTGEHEEPVQGGMSQAIGELVTCTRCIGTWTAAGLVSTQILAPRFGRLLTLSLAAAAANDFAQAAFAVLTARSNELEQRAG